MDAHRFIEFNGITYKVEGGVTLSDVGDTILAKRLDIWRVIKSTLDNSVSFLTEHSDHYYRTVSEGRYSQWVPSVKEALLDYPNQPEKEDVLFRFIRERGDTIVTQSSGSLIFDENRAWWFCGFMV
jgi:hypothetical protein